MILADTGPLVALIDRDQKDGPNLPERLYDERIFTQYSC